MTHSLDLEGLDLTTLMVSPLPPASEHEMVRLSYFFKMSTWTVEQGLCLLCRIDPDFSSIEWAAQKKGATNTKGATVTIFQPLGEELRISLYETDGSLVEDNPQGLIEERNMLTQADSAIWQLCNIWNSGTHSKTRYTPQYFIDWALGKNLQIGWIEWAIKSGEYVHPKNRGKLKSDISADIDADTLLPKSKSTALKIIGGLLISAYKWPVPNLKDTALS